MLIQEEDIQNKEDIQNSHIKILSSISNEDIRNRHIKTLSMSVTHVIKYIDAMFDKIKKGDIVEMTENHREYLKSHLNYINDNLLGRIKEEDDNPEDLLEIKNDL